MSELSDFYEDCYLKFDLQVFKLNPKAYKSVVQVVRYRLKELLNDQDYGIKHILKIINSEEARPNKKKYLKPKNHLKVDYFLKKMKNKCLPEI